MQRESLLFTKLEGSSHLQKSNIIVHWFLRGEMWVYNDSFDPEGLLFWLFLAQVMLSSSNIQVCPNVSVKKKPYKEWFHGSSWYYVNDREKALFKML